jgi:hypothetical protein
MVFLPPRRKLDARHWLTVSTLALLTSLGATKTAPANEEAAESVVANSSKQVIGATATVEEVKTDLLFKARVDTGATTSSLHVEDYVIKDEEKKMVDNVGKKIRFRINNHDGESEWLESKIANVSVIRTSVDREERYKVHLTLRVHKVQKRVLVTLNDRSEMKYPMLLGRNFLRGDFVVDVESKKKRDTKASPPAKEKNSPDRPTKTVDEKKTSA